LDRESGFVVEYTSYTGDTADLQINLDSLIQAFKDYAEQSKEEFEIIIFPITDLDPSKKVCITKIKFNYATLGIEGVSETGVGTEEIKECDYPQEVSDLDLLGGGDNLEIWTKDNQVKINLGEKLGPGIIEITGSQWIRSTFIISTSPGAETYIDTTIGSSNLKFTEIK